MTAPLRAALYLRVSTAKQAEQDISIPDQQRQGDEQQAVAGDAQHQRHPPLTQRVEDQDEEVIGFDGRGPVHRARLLSTEVAAQYSERSGAGKARGCPDRRETG